MTSDKPQERLLSHLLQLLGASETPLSHRELRGLVGLGMADRERFWGAWQQIETERREEIVQTMVELAEDNVDLDFGEVWLWLLEDRSPTVRAAAVEGMWEDVSPRALRRMRELLRSDPDGAVRAGAAMALSRFAHLAALGELEGDHEALLADLLAVLRDETQPLEVRRRALESAGYFADSPAVQDEIARAYRSNEQYFRESALVAMGRSMDPRWLPAVERELESGSPALRYEAAHAAGEMADIARPLLAKVIRLVDESDTEIALSAIWALGEIGGEPARRALERLSRSRDAARSEAAIEALKELNLGQMPY